MSDNIEMDITKESVRLEDAEKAEPATEKANAEEAAVAEQTGDAENEADAGNVAGAEEAQAATADEATVSSMPEEKEEATSPEEQIAELEDKYRRALAEVHNVRRRAEEERRNAMRYGVSAFARDMLSVCDNLGRALEAVERDKSDNNHQSASFRDLVDGIQVIQRELHDVMGRHGIKQINPLGERFDPNFHEAVFEVDKISEHEFDVVVQIAQSGYMIGERLLRPARVGIARAKGKTAAVAVETESPQTESPEPRAEVAQEEEDPAKAVS